MPSAEPDDVMRRARAAFLGLAVGDALGATTEFMTPTEIRAKYKVHCKIRGGGWLQLKAGQVTDDTEMSLCIARALTAAEGWDLGGIARQFATWLKGNPRDVGATCRRGIRDFMAKGQLETPYNEWDAGNGAVMRMLPVALFCLGDGELLERCALAQARLTHHHPLSDAACLCVGRMVQQALLGADRFALHALTRELVAAHPTFRFNHYRGNATAYVVDTLQTVFHYLFTTGDFEECLVGVVNQGGDADTTGAIAGMIAGAFYGPEAIPKDWLKKLDPQVRQEAEALAAYLKSEGVGKLYHSPFARAAKTAQIISAINRIPCVEESRLVEWRMHEEAEIQVRRRMKAIFDQSLAEVAGMGAIGLVSHGGPIAALLQELGIDPNELAVYRTRFDTTNPLPPAAAWQVEIPVGIDGRGWSGGDDDGAGSADQRRVSSHRAACDRPVGGDRIESVPDPKAERDRFLCWEPVGRDAWAVIGRDDHAGRICGRLRLVCR